MQNFIKLPISDIAEVMRVAPLSHKYRNHRKTMFHMVRDMKSQKYTDSMIYYVLNRHAVNNNIEFNKPSRGSRITKRCDDIIILYNSIRNTPPTRILDYGCANGSVISKLSNIFDNSECHGADIIDPQNFPENCTFTKVPEDPDNLLKFSDNYFDLISVLMVMHHIENQINTLRELYRILNDDGVIIIREHDCNNNNDKYKLDIYHGLYSLVWSNPKENPQFVKTFKSYYTTKDEFRELAESCGFNVTYPNEEIISSLHINKLMDWQKIYYVILTK